jgi:hypothetical protein
MTDVGSKRSGWERYERPTCDLCYRAPQWRHPLGGLRCDECPRPEASEPPALTMCPGFGPPEKR